MSYDKDIMRCKVIEPGTDNLMTSFESNFWNDCFGLSTPVMAYPVSRQGVHLQLSRGGSQVVACKGIVMGCRIGEKITNIKYYK